MGPRAEAHAKLIALLGDVGRMAEAEERFRAEKQLVGTTGSSYPILTEAWRTARESGSASSELRSIPHGRMKPPPTQAAGAPAAAVLPFDNMSGNPEERPAASTSRSVTKKRLPRQAEASVPTPIPPLAIGIAPPLLPSSDV